MGIDILFLLVAGYGFYAGYTKGIIETVLTTLAYLFGLMAAFKFAPTISEVLTSLFNNDSALMLIAGFAIAFIGTIFIIRLITNGLEGLLEIAHVNIVNQFAGGVLMAAFFVLIYSTLLWFANEARMVEDTTKKQSFSYVFLEEYPLKAKKVGTAFLPVFRNFWDESLNMMDKIKKNGIEKTESDANIYDIPDEEKEKIPVQTKEQPKPQKRKVEIDDEY